MIRTLSLSLLLASGVAAAAETATQVQPVQIDERLTVTSFGELRKGGNAFSPVYTFQRIPAKAKVAATEPQPEPKDEPATPAQNEGEVQEL